MMRPVVVLLLVPLFAGMWAVLTCQGLGTQIYHLSCSIPRMALSTLPERDLLKAKCPVSMQKYYKVREKLQRDRWCHFSRMYSRGGLQKRIII